jgi:hypothetical protein
LSPRDLHCRDAPTELASRTCLRGARFEIDGDVQKRSRLRDGEEQQITICYELLQMHCPARLSSNAATIHHTQSGLVVGTKLGTVQRGEVNILPHAK